MFAYVNRAKKFAYEQEPPAVLSQSFKLMASLALILSVVAVLLVYSQSTTPCANAQSGSCAVGDTEIFASSVVVNEDGNDADTRMEGDTDANVFYLDAGNDAVIIGAAAPDGSEKFRVNGDLRIEDNLLVDTVAKGGILGGTAADTLGVLAVGANDEVLTADSGESTGLKWASVGVPPTFLDKTSDETLNNNDSLQDDNDLTFSVTANKNYAVWGTLLIDSGTTPDFKHQWSLPASATADMTSSTAVDDVLPFNESDPGFATGGGAGTPTPLTFTGTITVQGNAGTAVIQWAQNTADGSDTKVLEGSWLAYRLLN